ncbi:hypothetical protein FQA39_LY13374 [Lamprigera yunnana]|nr:hypothetical protein FQA39_LY13374 [Lamprigera yunnana]
MSKLNISTTPILYRLYSTKSLPIVKVFKNTIVGDKIEIKGWVKSVRKMKHHLFLDVNDGSCHQNLQVVLSNPKFKSIVTGTSVIIEGILNKTPKGQLELNTNQIEICGNSKEKENHPFALKQSYTQEYLRKHLHFRLKTSAFSSLLRVRETAIFAIHDYFRHNGFNNVHTPILTSNDCEGAGETFSVLPNNEKTLKSMIREEIDREKVYFNSKTFLTVSGQLHLEAAAHSLNKVYTFGPTFRAENSKSRLHLSEFYMIEAECAFLNDLQQLIDIVENLLKEVTRKVLDKQGNDMDKCKEGSFNFSWLNKTFSIMTYEEACTTLTHAKLTSPTGLTKENEKFLVKYCGNTPVFVINWPKNLKPFYAKELKDSKVAALDLLVPNVGELIGGSLREDNYDVLKEKLPSDELNWYLDLRTLGGVSTGGFGLGFERYLQFLLGIQNIKDVIPFPRWPHNYRMVFRKISVYRLKRTELAYEMKCRGCDTLETLTVEDMRKAVCNIWKLELDGSFSTVAYTFSFKDDEAALKECISQLKPKLHSFSGDVGVATLCSEVSTREYEERMEILSKIHTHWQKHEQVVVSTSIENYEIPNNYDEPDQQLANSENIIDAPVAHSQNDEQVVVSTSIENYEIPNNYDEPDQQLANSENIIDAPVAHSQNDEQVVVSTSIENYEIPNNYDEPDQQLANSENIMNAPVETNEVQGNKDTQTQAQQLENEKQEQDSLENIYLPVKVNMVKSANMELFQMNLIHKRWSRSHIEGLASEGANSATQNNEMEENVLLDAHQISITNTTSTAPKTSHQKFKKAQAICMELATLCSEVSTREYEERMEILSKIHTHWQKHEQVVVSTSIENYEIPNNYDEPDQQLANSENIMNAPVETNEVQGNKDTQTQAQQLENEKQEQDSLENIYLPVKVNMV